ncbi:NAD/NADP octopine/nopaline dehydrogenase family protein [Tsukamurella sp. 8F]|uniref:NAD/NADP-dependent octopine/nopaline dehydrogenase family protein n=1 Tax=unclassified Tsukamurella TaxID=2633480 RepID=UPI0023B93E52|nr:MULTISPECIES: NAD/NADP-dependent octopine/nopaline dehydrogenase family protein [unclassified Tsukamurella]MDF0531259.1 NAD/NADP octopine/nopaline dehydrogenase family protein [Tsukamurella sp. 8J]MDF0585208.1 NAD/NADP octopine/nopaline dehydrogenase family protein [Tsukamurella sp. 8F]
MRITVIGGGHGSYAAAADMFEKGHQVTWWRRNGDEFALLLASGGLTVDDHRGARTVPVGTAQGIAIETELGRAVAGAEIVIAPVPAFAHEDLAQRMAPHLVDGQVVYLPPGSLGTVVFARALAAVGNSAKIAVAETGTLPYLARKHDEGTRVVISGHATRLPTGVLPARDSEWALALLGRIYPVEPVEDAMSAALMNAGPIIHPPLILMNAAPLEHFAAWDIHNEGTQDSIRRVTSGLDAERIAVRTALGYSAPHFPLADHYSADGDEWMYGNAAHEKLTDSGDWREKIDLHSHRYMREDVEVGLALLVSLGRWAQVPMPIATGLLAIATAITGRPASAGGRTLEALGLAELDRDAMVRILREGFAS